MEPITFNRLVKKTPLYTLLLLAILLLFSFGSWKENPTGLLANLGWGLAFTFLVAIFELARKDFYHSIQGFIKAIGVGIGGALLFTFVEYNPEPELSGLQFFLITGLSVIFALTYALKVLLSKKLF